MVSFPKNKGGGRMGQVKFEKNNSVVKASFWGLLRTNPFKELQFF